MPHHSYAHIYVGWAHCNLCLNVWCVYARVEWPASLGIEYHMRCSKICGGPVSVCVTVCVCRLFQPVELAKRVFAITSLSKLCSVLVFVRSVLVFVRTQRYPVHLTSPRSNRKAYPSQAFGYMLLAYPRGLVECLGT